jgi:spore germination protein KC
LFGVLLSAGCWDYREPDEVAWIMAIGVDKGRENLIRVSAQIAIPKDIGAGGTGGGGGGGGGGGEAHFVVAMDAPSIPVALELMNAFVDRRADLSHTKVVIFSRELAEEGLNRYFATLNRFYQFRPTSSVLISQDKAEETLRQANPILEDNPGKYWELITAGWQYTEFIPRATFQIIDQAIRTPGGSAMIPLVGLEREEPGPPDRTFKPKGEQIAGDVTRRGGVPVEFMGAAVFKAGRMVGAVNGDEVGVVKFVKGEIEETFEHIPDPCKRDKLIVVRIFPRQRPEIEIDLRGTGPPRVMATVFLEGDIVSIQGRTEYDEPELISVLEREVVKNRNEEAREAVERAQELEADIFGFGWQAKKQFLAWRDWEDYRWGEQFSHADIEVTFDLKVRRVGLVHESPLFRPD